MKDFFHPNTLSLKMLRVVFFIYLCVTLMITAGQIWAEFSRTQKDIAGELDALLTTFAKPAATSIWQLNQRQLDALGAGLISMPVIEAVDIINAKGEHLVELKTYETAKEPLQVFSKEKQLVWDLRGEKIILGTIQLTSSSTIVLDRLMFGFALIVVSAVIKFGLLWLLFIWAFKRFLHRPLCDLTHQISEIELSQIGSKRIILDQYEENELHRLQNDINHMLNKMASDKEEIARIEDERRSWLEREVALRTQELSEANQQLEHLASIDPLTNVNNHRSFFVQAQNLIHLSRRNKTKLCMLVLDIDYFKKINDTFGHSIGDEVLKSFAKLIGQNLRKTDCVGRIGGEEFAILLVDTSLGDAIKLADKIRLLVETTQIHAEDQLIQITTSIGVSEMREKDNDAHDIFKRADKFLYQAKENGRNRVEGLI